MATSTTYVHLLNSFEKAYTLPEAKKLLTPRWRAENEAHGAPPSTGFCYIAAEAAYHLLQNERPKGMCASYLEDGKPSTHWWILLKNGTIFDPTASQYTGLGESPPYHLGVGKGFLTSKPSKRAAVLMQMVTRLRA